MVFLYLVVFGFIGNIFIVVCFMMGININFQGIIVFFSFVIFQIWEVDVYQKDIFFFVDYEKCIMKNRFVFVVVNDSVSEKNVGKSL